MKGTVRTRDDCRRALQRLMGPGSEVQTHYDWLEGSKMCLVTTPGGRRYAGRGLTWQRAFEQVREQVVREFERRAGEEAAAG